MLGLRCRRRRGPRGAGCAGRRQTALPWGTAAAAVAAAPTSVGAAIAAAAAAVAAAVAAAAAPPAAAPVAVACRSWGPHG